MKLNLQVGFGEMELDGRGSSVFQKKGSGNKIFLVYLAMQEGGKGRPTYFLGVSAADRAAHSHTTGHPLARDPVPGLGFFGRVGRREGGVEAQVTFMEEQSPDPSNNSVQEMRVAQG